MSRWDVIRRLRDGLLEARAWGKRKGYWPPQFRVLLPGDKGDAEEAISDHLDDQADRRWGD